MLWRCWEHNYGIKYAIYYVKGCKFRINEYYIPMSGRNVPIQVSSIFMQENIGNHSWRIFSTIFWVIGILKQFWMNKFFSVFCKWFDITCSYTNVFFLISKRNVCSYTNVLAPYPKSLAFWSSYQTDNHFSAFWWVFWHQILLYTVIHNHDLSI